VEELKAGEREVEELTGVRAPDPPQPASGEPLTAEEWSYLTTQIAKTAEATRSLQRPSTPGQARQGVPGGAPRNGFRPSRGDI